MAEYSADAILGELRRLRQEYWAGVQRQEQRRGRGWREDNVRMDPNVVAAAAYIVKRLAARTQDVHLIGETELLMMELSEVQDADDPGGETYGALGATEERNNSASHPRS